MAFKARVEFYDGGPRGAVFADGSDHGLKFDRLTRTVRPDGLETITVEWEHGKTTVYDGCRKGGGR